MTKEQLMTASDPVMPILYEDNHVIVIEKPINVPTQEDESGDLDVLTLLKQDIKIRYNKPGNVYVGLVHRLDRPVGGVMVFAKTSKGASRLSDAFRKKEVEKTYVACVHGELPDKKGTLKHYLVKDSKKNMVFAVSPNYSGAKQAILHYEQIGSKSSLKLVRVTLETGRPHQIRVQFASIGCPLYGDQKYGKGTSQPGQQLALWSYRLMFPHPTTKEELVFESFPPDAVPWSSFQDLLRNT